MKLILVCLFSIAVCASSSYAQQLATDDLSDFLSSATEVAGRNWRVAYAYDSRTVTFTSIQTIQGSDYSGGFPNDHVAEYPVRISFRLTSKPTEKRIQTLKSLNQAKLEHLDGMSDNAKAWAGYSKERPMSLSKSEWSEFLKYAELRRQVESLAMPTHTYKSLHFVDVSRWHIEPSRNQSETGKRLLAERDKLQRLAIQFK